MYYNRNLITASEQAVTRKDASGVFDLQAQAVSQNEKDWPGSETAAIVYDVTLGPDYLTITIQSTGTVDHTIDWGDGTVDENLTTNTPSHTYSNVGSYKIKIFSSSVYRPYFDNHASIKRTITKVEITENANLGTSLRDAFDGASKLTAFKCAFSVTNSVTDARNMFSGCAALSTMDLFDTSSVTDFGSMFYACRGLTLFPEFDFSSATGMGSMFRITEPAALPNLDVSNIVQFSATWRQCSMISFPSFFDFSSAASFNEAWRSSLLYNFPANMFDNTGTLSSVAFRNAFNSCRLTAQSIENILTSLDTNGATGIELHIGSGQNAAYSTWSSAAQTALTNLQNKSWTVTYNS